MKNTTITSIVAGLALGGTAFAGTSGKAVPVTEPEVTSPLSTALTVGYASTYEFRGLELGDNLFNADLTATYALNEQLSLYAGAWYGTMWDESYNEIDLTAGASYDLGFGTGGLLYRHYLYDGDINDNNEVGLLFTTKDYAGFTLSAASYYDFEFEGWYFELGAGYSYKFSDMVSLALSSGVSYVLDYNGVDGDGFNHVFVQAGLPIALRENVTFTPFIKGTFAIDKLEDLGADDLVLGGANLTVTF